MVKTSGYTKEWIRSHYREYLRSAHWSDVKRRYQKSKLRKSCYVCYAKKLLQLHHKTYKRVGEERLTDLMILCASCHLLVHTELRERLADGQNCTLWSIAKKVRKQYRGKGVPLADKSRREFKKKKRHPRNRGRRHKVVIYTDGGCYPNPGIGGWAAIVKEQGARPVELCDSQRQATNNEMEMRAVLEGVSFLVKPSAITIYTDSRLVIGWLGLSWKCNYAHIRRLKEQILLQVQEGNHRILFVKVKGHSGNHGNKRADSLASSCIALKRALISAPPEHLA